LDSPGAGGSAGERAGDDAASRLGGPPAIPKQVVDAERTLIGYMVLGEETLHPVLTELLEAASWCSEIGLPPLGGGAVEAVPGAVEVTAAAVEGVAAAVEEIAATAEEVAAAGEPLTGTEATVLDWFLAPVHRGLVRTVLRLARDGVIEGAQLVDALAGGGEEAGGDAAARLASRVVFEAQSLPDEPERAIRDCLNVLKEHRLNSRIEELHRRITDLERHGAKVEREYADLMRELIDLEQRSDGGIGHW